MPKSRDTACQKELGFVLSVAERRIALYQVIADRARGGKMMPTTWRLAQFFGVTRGTVDNDLDVLRNVIAQLELPLYRLSTRITSLDEVFLRRAEDAS